MKEHSAGFYTLMIPSLQFLFAEGVHPPEIRLLTHDLD